MTYNRQTLSQQVLRDNYSHPSGTFVELTSEQIEQSIGSRFEKQVQKYPERLAVKSEQYELSYQQLNQMANQIAHALMARSAPSPKSHQAQESPSPKGSVGILLNNNAPMLAAILAILKIGHPYVPLEPSLPQERLAYYVSDSGTNLIITDEAHQQLALELAAGDHQVVNIDQLASTQPLNNPSLAVTPEAIAYIYYTSGSTGKPKSVYNTHRNLLHHTRRNINSFGICAEDRVICLKSFSFHGALKDIFGTLLSGASLHLYPLKQKGTLMLADWLLEKKITIYNSVATVFRQLVSSLKPEMRWAELRHIFIGGERIKMSDIGAYKRHFASHSLLSLGLGSTETGAATRIYIDQHTELSTSVVPVGYPLEDMEVMILGENGEKVGPNQEGQIAVKSQYLSIGYWNNPQLTAQKFLAVAHSQNGQPYQIYLTGDIGYVEQKGSLYCLGRKDFQVKIRGYRVGLEEIEQALLKHPMIKEGVVVAKALSGGEEQVLVTYYVSPSVLTVTELRRFLLDKLPDYMIPSAFVQLDTFPVTPYGKLDIKALRAPERSRPLLQTPYLEPQTPMEELLSSIWSKVICIDQVGVHDNFFDLGGHSILMMRLLTDVERVFNIKLPIGPFLEQPSIEGMARLIEQEIRHVT